VDDAIAHVIQDSAFVGSLYVDRFEKQFADYVGVRHCVGVGSGTDALLVAYKVIGLERGDEVIVPALTFIATSAPMSFLGAKPVFADIDPKTYTLCPAHVRKLITKKTKAIVVVHIHGQPAPMREIMAIARTHKLKVIEDCSHAHGARIGDRHVGTFGDVGVFSFNPGKVFGAYGDAGAIVTNKQSYATLAWQFRNHGRHIKDKHLHTLLGLNLRMDGIQAAILSAKLPHLSSWSNERREIAQQYSDALSDVVRTPYVVEGTTHAYLHYVITVQKRDALLAFLREYGIDAGIHYPIPLHLQPVYRASRSSCAKLPCAEYTTRRLISLPIFPEMTSEEIRYVCEMIRKFYQKRSNVR